MKQTVSSRYNGIKITKQATVVLTLTADEWELYGLNGRDEAALAMNAKISAALNEGRPTKAYIVLKEYENYGANDSEGYGLLNEIIEDMT